MTLLVADCPRCTVSNTTFDVGGFLCVSMEFENVRIYEVFSICRNCKFSTVFDITQHTFESKNEIHNMFCNKINNNPSRLLEFNDSLNALFKVNGPVFIRNHASIQTPNYLPEEIKAAFEEGSSCYSIGSYNASATMYRLCVDLVSRKYLPDPGNKSVAQPNDYQRRSLAPRLTWLFDNKLLPSDLRDLATAIREEGNDGAHVGSLSKADVDDMIDFTTAFLDRLITGPEKLRLAKERRDERRAAIRSE